MEDERKNNNRLEDDDEFDYIRHLKRDTFKLDDDDTEHYYCKYCKKKMKISYMKRHDKSMNHELKMMFYKEDNLSEQIYIRLVEDFEAGKYDPNDVNLTGEERINRFKQLEKETWEKYDKAKLDGYFDMLDFDEDINFEDYNFYHEKGIKLNARKEVFSDDPDFQTLKSYYSDDSDDSDSDDEIIIDDEPENSIFW